MHALCRITFQTKTAIVQPYSSAYTTQRAPAARLSRSRFLQTCSIQSLTGARIRSYAPFLGVPSLSMVTRAQQEGRGRDGDADTSGTEAGSRQTHFGRE